MLLGLPFASYATLLVGALYDLMALTFDLLTSKLVRELYVRNHKKM